MQPVGWRGRALPWLAASLAGLLATATTAMAQTTGTDYGDAPSPYPTLKQQNGAVHAIKSPYYLGAWVDAESDGQPNASATGDDLSPLGAIQDEDGVKFIEPLVPGNTVHIEVTAGFRGNLFAWIDFNRDGDWSDPGEQIFKALPLGLGLNTPSFDVPKDALVGTTYARFRFTSATEASFVGALQDGEVEDYRVTVGSEAAVDFGDAPEKYPTLLANGGAGHGIVPGLSLGDRVDGEKDGQPNPNATGDDLNPSTANDEDGVVFVTGWVAGQVATVNVTCRIPAGTTQGVAFVDAWVDFDGNQSWADAGEQVLVSKQVTAGLNVLTFAVPSKAKAGATFARFRLSRSGKLAAGGMASDGEVEDYQVFVEAAPSLVDFGDAPEKYPTTLGNGGASHVIVQGLALGATVDGEVDGQASGDAQGDDQNPANSDDEDGVVFAGPLVAGGVGTVQVTVTAWVGNTAGMGVLDAWVDFNGNQSWGDPGEQVFGSLQLSHGVTTLQFPVPSNAKLGTTYARFRLSRKGGLAPGGAAEDGEVEDHQVGIEAKALSWDFGDAPGKYPTLVGNNGARHVIMQGLSLGYREDGEQDGQPTLDALGDDKNPLDVDDEDGVGFLTPLVAGQVARVEVKCQVPYGQAGPGQAFVDAWIDFNANESWGDPGEQVLVSVPVTQGSQTFEFLVPPTSVPGATYARFRLSRKGQLAPGGAAEDGEVEDYVVGVEGQTVALDFGDAPGKYPTLLSQDGARHVIFPGLGLGERIDREQDGQPEGSAKGDDLNPLQLDDEDGVVFATALVAGRDATVHVTVRTTTDRAFLDGWMDFNGNESWGDAGEQVFLSVPVAAGLNALTFTVPASARPGATFARFRLSLKGRLGPGGAAPDGEVEDYQVGIESAEVSMDFGDAPKGYPTLLAEDGARHAFHEAFRLGKSLDLEVDGQPEAMSLGDDQNPAQADDEDGVTWLTPLVPGREAVVRVSTPSQRAFLNAWIDFGGDGGWAQATDRVATAYPLLPGDNDIRFLVPADSRPGTTFSRFRLSTVERLDYKGAAPNGEVEDHRVRVLADDERCDLSCAGRDFWITFPGNYAPDPDNPVVLSLSIQGVPGTTVQVTQPGTGYGASLVIPPSASLHVPLPSTAHLGDLQDAVKPLGVRVEASDEVIVAGYNRVRYSSDSFRAMHVSTLGRAYVVMASPNLHSGAPALNGSQFAIVGVRPETLVQITPTVTTGSRVAGVPYTILLNPGDVYQLRATNDAPADVTGTIIRASQPVAVFGGHRCANLPTSGVWFCDHLVEQLPPVNNWGSDFVVAPFAGRTGGDWARVVAAMDGTSLVINGAPVAVLARGQSHAFAVTSPGARVQSSRPVMLAQFARSADADVPPTTQGDPFMLVVQATRHFQGSYVLDVPATGFASSFIHLIVPNPAVGSVLVDGVPVPAGAYAAIPGAGHAVARLPVGPGLHTASGPVGFGASLYGWNEYESYGHPGCFFAGDVQPPRITTELTSLTVNVDDTQQQGGGFASVPSLTAAAKVEDNCAPELRTPEQEPKAGTLLPVGLHRIRLSLLDDSGNEGEAEVFFNVVDPSPVTIECPPDLFVPCEVDEGAFVQFQVRAFSRFNPDVPVFTEPPSGSYFPSGVTEVRATAIGGDGKEVTCTFRVYVDCERKVVVGPQLVQDGQLKLQWADPRGTLEQAPTPAGPWTPVIQGVSNYSVRIEGIERYFRVRY